MRKIRIEFIRSKLAERGYKLLSTEYKGANSKLIMECSEEHIIKLSWAKFKKGSRCKICYLKRRTLRFNYIKNEIEKSSYKVLFDESTHNNSRTKLKLECDEGHIVYISWSSWKAKVRCKKCSLKKRDVKARLKYEFIKKEFEKRGCILLSKTYKNAFGKLDYICARGHVCSTKWNYFQQDCGCIRCAIEDNTGPGNPNWKGGISCEPYCDI